MLKKLFIVLVMVVMTISMANIGYAKNKTNVNETKIMNMFKEYYPQDGYEYRVIESSKNRVVVNVTSEKFEDEVNLYFYDNYIYAHVFDSNTGCTKYDEGGKIEMTNKMYDDLYAGKVLL